MVITSKRGISSKAQKSISGKNKMPWIPFFKHPKQYGGTPNDPKQHTDPIEGGHNPIGQPDDPGLPGHGDPVIYEGHDENLSYLHFGQHRGITPSEKPKEYDSGGGKGGSKRDDILGSSGEEAGNLGSMQKNSDDWYFSEGGGRYDDLKARYDKATAKYQAAKDAYHKQRKKAKKAARNRPEYQKAWDAVIDQFDDWGFKGGTLADYRNFKSENWGNLTLPEKDSRFLDIVEGGADFADKYLGKAIDKLDSSGNITTGLYLQPLLLATEGIGDYARYGKGEMSLYDVYWNKVRGIKIQGVTIGQGEDVYNYLKGDHHPTHNSAFNTENPDDIKKPEQYIMHPEKTSSHHKEMLNTSPQTSAQRYHYQTQNQSVIGRANKDEED